MTVVLCFAELVQVAKQKSTWALLITNVGDQKVQKTFLKLLIFGWVSIFYHTHCDTIKVLSFSGSNKQMAQKSHNFKKEKHIKQQQQQ